MKSRKAKWIEVVAYEPTVNEEKFFSSNVIRDLDDFNSISYVIVYNRLSNIYLISKKRDIP